MLDTRRVFSIAPSLLPPILSPPKYFSVCEGRTILFLKGLDPDTPTSPPRSDNPSTSFDESLLIDMLGVFDVREE